jgi:hypothetical protein
MDEGRKEMAMMTSTKRKRVKERGGERERERERGRERDKSRFEGEKKNLTPYVDLVKHIFGLYQTTKV